MIFALLMLMVLATLTAMKYGRAAYIMLFLLATIASGAVLVIDIDTPLTLAF